MRLQISLDYDGCIVRMWDDVLALLNYKLGTEYEVSDIECWDWPYDEGIGDEFWAALDLLEQQGWRAVQDPYDEDTASVLDNLAYINNGVDIVTMNNHEAGPHFREWLARNTQRADQINVITKGRGDIDSKASMSYEVYVDDKPELAQLIGTEYPEKQCFVMDAPWNRPTDEHPLIDCAEHDNVERVTSWRELHDYLFPLITEQMEAES